MQVLLMSKITPLLVVLIAALTIALFLRGGEVLTALAISTTNSTVATANITNTPPTCTGVTCYDVDDDTANIKLSGGGTRQVKCNATCNDLNGWGNVKNYTGQFSSTTGSVCSASLVNCYPNTSCQNYSAINTTAQKVQCTYTVWYNAGNTSKYNDWFGNVTAGDIAGQQNGGNDTIDMAELLAIGVNNTLAFGSLAPDANESTCTHGTNAYNYGNVEIDVAVNGTALTCTSGSTAAAYIRGNLTSAGAYSLSYPLTATLGGPDTGSRFNTGIAASTTTTAPTAHTAKTIYWGLGVPSGVSGNCEGIMWFAAQLS